MDENKKLKEVIDKYKEIIEENSLKEEVIKKNYSNNTDTMLKLLNDNEIKTNQLKRNISKPYFARIDFKADNSKIEDICYIGKIGVMDSDNKIITVDWRAPISSLYYDANVGKAIYQAPEGKISGILSKKRQYEIEDGKLISYQDVDTISNDDILKPYLNTSINTRLKNIISTIQKEQNEIIRETIEKDIIVQGVAGSGKTTVALHRIAYLVYQNRNIVNADQYMIIGPNKFFVNYISGVLPDLSVDEVLEYDLLGFTSTFLNENIILDKSDDNELTYYKNTMKFKEELKKFIDELKDEVIPEEDLSMDGYSIISQKAIKDTFNEELTLNRSFKDAIEKTSLLISKYIKGNQDKLIIKVNKKIDEKFSMETDEDKLKSLSKIRENIKKEIQSGCIKILKKYFKVIDKKTTILYKRMLKENSYIDNNTYKIRYEDLVGLLYLRYRINGNNNYIKYRQVVVDESQDYGDFFFYIIKKIMPKASFSIFGDLAQTIYEYRTIKKWDKLLKVGYDNNIRYMNKSYRTTMEIMSEANKINKFLGLPIADAVIRHGEEVKYLNKEDIYIALKKLVSKNHKTIAIISKTKDQANKVYKYIKDRGIDITLISDDSTEYIGGICSITSALSKGLEFDGVIINKVNNENFNKDNEYDMKLLYVSMTRALHELIIIKD